MSRLSSSRLLVLTSSVILFLIIIYTYTNNSPQLEPQVYTFRSQPTLVKSKHIILVWTTFWTTPSYDDRTGKTLCESGCDPCQCSITYDRSLYNQSSAVFFVAERLSDMPTLPRPPGQRWIFFTLESPEGHKLSTTISWYWSKIRNDVKWKGQFNWTMTYRFDSDMIVNYARIVQKKNPQKDDRNYVKILTSKPKMAVWIVGHCVTSSLREYYVRQLNKAGIKVDVFGYCGKHKLSRGNDLKLVNSTYKYYLSFENSLCEDYLTEKLYKVLHLDVIPIVRGGANYSKYIPHKWYINTADFSSVRMLANYIKHLEKNPWKYSTYFKRRHDYDVLDVSLFQSPGWCALCRRLHNPSEPGKIYRDIFSWWDRVDTCHPPTDILA